MLTSATPGPIAELTERERQLIANYRATDAAGRDSIELLNAGSMSVSGRVAEIKRLAYQANTISALVP